MANPIEFDPYLEWVDVTDPNNVPEGARVVGASDLLRYEKLGQDVAAKLGDTPTLAADLAPALAGLGPFADLYAPKVRRGTLASRPAAPAAGSEWVQTDAAGGNAPGTRSYYDGTAWYALQPDQIAQVGCQSNSWFTTMPDPNPPASNMTFAVPNAGAGGISLALFRLRKDITVASLVLRKATGAASYVQAIYRLDGTTLTRVATTGELVNPNLDNNIRRDPLLSPVTLTAGTTYYYALTSGPGTFQYYQRSGGSIHTANMIGMVFGEATALYQSGSFHPAPATVDTASGTWLGWQNPPVHFGLAYT